MSAEHQLQSFVERIERLDEEKAAINADIRDIYAEAKANGYVVPALKLIMKERRQDPAKRTELEAIVDLYRASLAGAGARTHTHEAA